MDELGAPFAIYGVTFAAVFARLALLCRHAARSHGRLALAGVGLRFGLPGSNKKLLGPLCWAHGRRSRRALEAPSAK